MQRKPILFVDVDGVISLWGFDSNKRPEGVFANVDGILHFLSGTAGPHLLALSERFELVWCTGWEDRANDYLPHALGLPGPLPYLTFERVGPGAAHWKLDAIEAHAGDRPAAWIDDQFDDSCHAWARARGVPTLLELTEPASGMTPAHVERLLTWAEALPYS